MLEVLHRDLGAVVAKLRALRRRLEGAFPQAFQPEGRPGAWAGREGLQAAEQHQHPGQAEAEPVAGCQWRDVAGLLEEARQKGQVQMVAVLRQLDSLLKR